MPQHYSPKRDRDALLFPIVIDCVQEKTAIEEWVGVSAGGRLILWRDVDTE